MHASRRRTLIRFVATTWIVAIVAVPAASTAERAALPEECHRLVSEEACEVIVQTLGQIADGETCEPEPEPVAPVCEELDTATHEVGHYLRRPCEVGDLVDAGRSQAGRRLSRACNTAKSADPSTVGRECRRAADTVEGANSLFVYLPEFANVGPLSNAFDVVAHEVGHGLRRACGV